MNILDNVGKIFTNPTSIIAIFSIVILIGALLIIRRVKLNTKTLVVMAMAIALSVVLQFIKIYTLPMGGSVTLGSMVPILFIAYIYGAEFGILAGGILGLMNFITEPYILHPVQVLLDYFLAFMALGVSGYFKNNRLIGTFAAIFLRFIFHVLSGVVFFSEYAGDMNPVLYSIIYNGSYLLPELIISLIMIYALPINRIRKAVKV